MKLLYSLILILALSTSAFAKQTPSLPKNFLTVPLIRQSTDYSCGPAALQAVLFYWKVFDGYETELYPLLRTTEKDGTSAQWLAVGAKNYGLDAKYLLNMTLGNLRASLAKGETVILNIQAWKDPDEKNPLPWKDRWDDGHFVVLVGMDSHYIYLMDPSVSGSYGYMPIRELKDRWHDVIETTPGNFVKEFNIGVVISGKTHVKTVPAPMISVE